MVASDQATFSDPLKPSELYKAAGDRLLDMGAWERAVDFFTAALGRAISNHQRGPIHESLGEAYFHLNDMKMAQSHYQIAYNGCLSSLGADAGPCRVIRSNMDRIAELMQSPGQGFVDRSEAS